MRTLFTILIVLFAASAIRAQPYTILSQKTIGCSGNDLIVSFLIDNDGNYVAAGQTSSSCALTGTGLGRTDGWVIKLDTSGKKIWSTVLGGAKDDNIFKIIKTQDGGYLTAGFSLSNTDTIIRKDYDFWVAKLDRNGAILWEKFYGGEKADQAFDAVETSDGGFIIVGFTSSLSGDVTNFKGAPCDAWIIKIDHAGTLLWQKAYGSSKGDNAYAVFRTIGDDYMVIGRAGAADSNVASVHTRDDVWLIKMDVQGNILWSKTYGGSGWEVGRSILETRDSGFLLGCYSTSSDGDVNRNYGGEDMWAVKTDKNGNLLWEHNYGGTTSEAQISSIIESKEGGYMLMGMSQSNDSDAVGNHGLYGDVLAIKTTDSGIVQWSHMFGGSSGESTPTTYQLADSSYIFGTLTQSSNGDVVGSHGSGEGWLVNFGNPRKPGNVGVTTLSGNQNLSIFPIPCRKELNISGLKAGDKLIEMVDITGKKLDLPMSSYSGRVALDVGELPAGVYFLRIMRGGEVQHYRILHD